MAQEESVVSVAAVFDHPFASALLLAALASWWMYPGHPRLMGVVVPLLVVPPVLVISRHIVPAPVRPALYALGSFYVADRLRDFAAVVPLLERTLFLIEVAAGVIRSEEHTSELQSRLHLVCRLLLEKKKKKNSTIIMHIAHTILYT